MKIAVAGTGYVGLSLATLLCRENEVVALDIVKEKVDMINNRISPIKDNEIEYYFMNNELNLRATLNDFEAFDGADFVIISTPTNYDPEINFFDTSSVENTIEKIIKINPNSTIIIKSTVPVGFTERVKERYNTNNIIFSPEFLREGTALYDSLYPSRIILGEDSERARIFGNLLRESSLKKDTPILYMNNTEAEAVKLFSNTYLAMRVAYFNELDTYAELNGLNTKDIIDGVCLDSRIGTHYNNPSFGYGGYCLPKDTKQLLANYKDIPQNMIEAIVKSNDTRKKHIANMVLSHNPNTVGIYRLTMKKDSDNFRTSAIQDVIKNIVVHDIDILIYEPTLDSFSFNGYEVVKDFYEFTDRSDIIIANRIEKPLVNVRKKVYTRDLFKNN